MNTMADGARERLVAQIGEALFGQPGLTLMELAEKVKAHDLSLDQTIGERDRYQEVADELAGHIAAITGVDIGEHSSANCPWQNAIEAAEEYRPAQPSPATCKDGLQVQPSPAGHGDARAIIEEFVQCATLGRPHGKLLAQARDFLAARQPVGQEPAAFANPDDAEDVVGPSRLQSIRDSNGLPGKIIAARYTVPLYVSPPVQAADLGQFRALAAKFDGLGDEEVGDAYSGPYYECARQLRALIYSQAVGQEPFGWWLTDENGHGYLARNPGQGVIDAYQERSGCSATSLYVAPDAQAVDLGSMPEGWRLSKKATCYQLSHGNDIVGNLIGPDAEENAAIIARVLDSKAVGK